eukprot:CAMPEP_0197391484 /NCGR_PEP_ID=MMETSP1165-20131217/3130_1 /TAXON_ID=284809 /ORGANISM="Chrysocystis fragilis, Strain CCMP3189" /LENGTH=357 /DNA_ID=CAMNT_0042917073 /DNA_START=93 /DNA_END=1162 /DNA_ORIENTATION=+
MHLFGRGRRERRKGLSREGGAGADARLENRRRSSRRGKFALELGGRLPLCPAGALVLEEEVAGGRVAPVEPAVSERDELEVVRGVGGEGPEEVRGVAAVHGDAEGGDGALAGGLGLSHDKLDVLFERLADFLAGLRVVVGGLRQDGPAVLGGRGDVEGDRDAPGNGFLCGFFLLGVGFSNNSGVVLADDAEGNLVVEAHPVGRPVALPPGGQAEPGVGHAPGLPLAARAEVDRPGVGRVALDALPDAEPQRQVDALRLPNHDRLPLGLGPRDPNQVPGADPTRLHLLGGDPSRPGPEAVVQRHAVPPRLRRLHLEHLDHHALLHALRRPQLLQAVPGQQPLRRLDVHAAGPGSLAST